MDYGPLDAKQCQFAIGEILAAIHSVHDAGFVFNDLKPENVLITEVGHIKITDFGACRPYGDTGLAALRGSKQSLNELRNGDWRDTECEIKGDVSYTDPKKLSRTLPQNRNTDDGISLLPVEGDGFEDCRVEGTPAYLPLEVLSASAARKFGDFDGTMTSLAVDSWSLGCVASFCREGRPPFFGDKYVTASVRILFWASGPLPLSLLLFCVSLYNSSVHHSYTSFCCYNNSMILRIRIV
jgi:serine/threonine protein kinase